MADDAVAIVTDGDCDRGRDAARALGARGFAVVVVYLRDQPRAEAVVEEIVAAGGIAVSVRADIEDELDVERLFRETKAAFGGVDLVVHAGGASVLERHAARELRAGGLILTPDALEPRD